VKIGKLDNETLERLVLGRVGAHRPEVIVGPGIGEDCAVLDFGEYECVLSTDPITASASRIGSLAVHISCNDVASNGVEPMAIMLTVLLPPSVTEDEISEIARQADEAAKSLGVQIIGGHTEVTDIVTQPLVSATAIGRAAKAGPASAAEPGDLIVATKTLALEGTAIAAGRRENDLRLYLTSEEIEHAMAMLEQISVVKEGVIAGQAGVKAMHDVTEGGVLGAIWEVCAREGVGAEIHAAALPFDPVTLALCAVLDLDPMRLISSGSMLMIVSEKKWAALFSALSEAGLGASVIGRVEPPENDIVLVMKNGERETVGPPGPDEIYRI
jgi:hydrogenase expression/formation protein HypE